jgi:TatD DNase family protein
MWFDTHCHLDAPEFREDLPLVLARAAAQGVTGILIPAVQVSDFDHVIETVEKWQDLIPHICFTLGIHPLFTVQAEDQDIEKVRSSIEKYLHHPRFMGVGEIGLDYFVDYLDNEKQEWFFEEQLKMAKDFELPIVMHVRKSQDQLLKRLRQIRVSGGIAHAFNGSFVQAQHFLDLNFVLGFGGTLTYDRALQIRRLAQEFSEHSYVLETDSPDIPPAWLMGEESQRNEPVHLPRIAQTFAYIRKISLEHCAQINIKNASRVLPKLRQLIAMNF